MTAPALPHAGRLCATGAVTLPRQRRRRWSLARIAEFVLTATWCALALAGGYVALGPLVPLPF